MKTRVIRVSAIAVVAVMFPYLLAGADDGIFMPDPAATGSIPVEPLLPGPVADAVQPAPVQPAPTYVPPAPTFVQPATSKGASAGNNPFVMPASVSTAAPASLAATNPFAAPAPVQNTGAPAPFALPAVPGAATAAGGGDEVDLTALRYYASTGDMARVGAETRRLQALYPDWEPPEDLFATPSNVDEQPLWDLFAQGRYYEERLQIKALQAANPGWRPSADLMNKLQNAEARVAMTLAYSLGNWDEVIEVGRQRASILVCDQIESLWQVGEAFARKSDFATAFESYKYVLDNCADPKDRLSTVQKASLLLPSVGMDALVLLGRPLPDGTSEFMSVGFDDLRRRMASNINDRFTAFPVTTDELERFVRFVRLKPTADDVSLIAWYYYGQKEWDAAQAWFSMGSRLKRDSKYMEGQILSLRAAGQTNEALAFAEEVKDRSPELTQQYIELVSEILSDPETTFDLPSRTLRDFEDLVLEEESALGAQAIGWRYVEDEKVKRAGEWFDRSVDWEVTEGGIGQAVVASRRKHYKTLKSIKARYGDDYAELEDFTVYTQRMKKARSVSVKSNSRVKAVCTSKGLLALFVCDRT